MGKYKKGILGAFSGKVGTVIGSSWKGIEYMRSLPKASTKAPTDLQMIQRAKFGLVSGYFRPVSELLNLGFQSSILRPVALLAFLFCFLTITAQIKAQVLIQGSVCQSGSAQAKRILVRQIYTSQIGVHEMQSNSGPAVEQYLHYVNLPKGNPWCAAFVCWTFGQAGVGNPRTGWSPGLFPANKVIWNRESRTRSQESRPCHCERSVATQGVSYAYPPSLTTNNEQPTTPFTGDIFGLYFAEKGRIAHVGFVDEWMDPWVTTVEGNTNVLGGREGDGVYRRRRLTRTVYKVARYVGSLAALRDDRGYRKRRLVRSVYKVARYVE